MGAQLPRDNKTYTTTQETPPHLWQGFYTIPLRDSPVRPRWYRAHGIA